MSSQYNAARLKSTAKLAHVLMARASEQQEVVKKKRKWTRVGTPPRECQICGDGAYGYNYGAVTCESCKAFFRRHLNKTDIQPCPGTNNCEMTKKTRKYCPSCRVKKCVQVGMRPEVNPLKRDAKSESESQSPVTVKEETVTEPAGKTALSMNLATESVEATSSMGSECISVSGKRVLTVEEFNRMRKVCNLLVLIMNEPFKQSDLSVMRSGSAPAFEFCGLGEVLLKRFVRFAKKIPEFEDHFSFDEKIMILRKTLFTCHIFNGVYSFDTAGRKVMLENGTWKIMPRENVVESLKKFGAVPNEADMLMISKWVNLNKSLRETFPNCWQLITAALTMMTMFSPDFYDRSSMFNSQSTSEEEREEKLRNWAVVTKILPLYASYTLFIRDYIAQQQAESGNNDQKQLADLVKFCMEQLLDVRSITSTLSERIGFIIALDPTSAMNAVPLYYELKDSY